MNHDDEDEDEEDDDDDDDDDNEDDDDAFLRINIYDVLQQNQAQVPNFQN